MELIHGDDLAKKRGKEKLSRKELDEFLVVLIRVCDAVAFAHNKGIAHLDIKPQNIQIGPFGEVLLCDWGLSKVSGQADVLDLPEELDNSLTADLTVRGVMRGTPGYMSPSLSQGNEGEFKVSIYSPNSRHNCKGAPALNPACYKVLQWPPISRIEVIQLLAPTTL